MPITSTKKQLILFCFFLVTALCSYSQKPDSAKSMLHFNGAATLTNNGISLIPTFSLGKPAAIFEFSITKKRLSFEPQLRFAIEGAKPWSFIFWVRYKMVNTSKFKMSIGAHPSFIFQNSVFIQNNVSKNVILTRRFFAAEIFPNYIVKKNVSVGLYYLYGHGLDETAHNHFLALTGSISNIKLSKNYFFKAVSQVYYLRLTGNDGIYATSTFTLTKKNFPLAIQSIINKTIQSNIISKNFVWNASLIYSF